ncbi:hypothetical protein CF335_g6753 [Tilletia laevis]|nr:hypothetical protein CF335_g6753 [Tilletia laevis]
MLFFLLFVSFPTGRARSTSAGLDGIEGRWLEGVKEAAARGYARAKEWVTANPPASESTDITMSQSLAIQEKSISSWSFDPDYEDNPSVFFVGRTELTYLADGQGMAAEGGGTCMLSNLPLSKPSRTKKCQGPNDIHQGANNYVGINFDDDPTQSIPRLKQFLLKNHISATRFLTGGQVAGMTSAFKDIIKDPSPQLAVHTYTHQQMTATSTTASAPSPRACSDFATSRDIMTQTTGALDRALPRRPTPT